MFHFVTRLRWLIVVAVLLAGGAARAEYFNFNVPHGVDGISQEVRYPVWAESTYNAIWSSHIEGPNRAGVYFYGGIPEAKANDPNSSASIIWSFWPVGHPITPGDTVKVAWSHPQMYAPFSVGEGASGKASGQWPQLKTGVWYQFVMRLWHPADAPGITYAGQWLRDGADNRWYHLATMSVPFPATGLSGHGGFIEDFGHGNRNPRRTDFRMVYGHAADGWKAAPQFTPSVRQRGEKGRAELIDDGTAAYFETCSGADYKAGVLDYDAKQRQITLTLKQPEKPAFPAPAIEGPRASRCGNQWLVEWTTPATAAPQLAYKIEALDRTGKVVATSQAHDPEARQAIIETNAADVGSLRLTITDIFDQTCAATIEEIKTASPNPDRSPSGTLAPGLDFSYVEAAEGKKSEERKTLAQFAALNPPALHGTANGPDLSQRRGRTSYGLSYSGFLKAPRGGFYQFRLTSLDGSRLTIDGKTVVDNDGVHSFTDQSGAIALSAGLHAIGIDYFHGANRGEGSMYGDRLQLEWQGPGISRQIVPLDAYSRSAAPMATRVQIAAPASAVSNAAVTLNVNIMPANVVPARVSYFVDETVWAMRSAAPWNTTAIMPTGTVTVRARVFTRDGAAYDSPPARVQTRQSDTSPWQLAQIGTPAPRRPLAAAASGKDAIYLVGDGLNFAWQTVTGDATLIAHVASRPDPAQSTQEDGTRPAGDWLGGLLFRSDLIAHDTFMGDAFCTVYARADRSTHLQCPHDHNGGGPVAGPDLGHYDWLKLERRGDVFTASFSKDGQTWEAKGTRTMKLPRQLHAGVCTFSKPSLNNNLNAWRFDQIRISQP